MKKIICFDGWARGAHHLTRLIPAFRKNNLEISLIHFGSWGNEPNSSEYIIRNGLPEYDISYFNGKDLKVILEEERADLVLFLSLDSFPHKAVNRYCRDLKIPTVHLLHGIHSIYDFESDNPFGSVNPIKRLILMRKHIIKVIFRYWPSYVKALFQTGGTLKDFFRFFYDIKDRFLAKLIPKAAKDSKANHMFVYISSDIEYAQSRYGYLRNEITVIGNPDFIEFGVSSNDIMACFSPNHKKNKYVLYFDTALVHYGQIFSSDDEFIQSLLELNKKLDSIGKKLIVKPHPATKKNSYIMESLKQNNVILIGNDEMISIFQTVCACIVEPTSIALLPTIYGIPILLNKMGNFSSLSYGKTLKEYPMSFLLKNIDEITNTLELLYTNVDKKKLKDWIIKNNGPFPLSDMPSRIGSKIQSILNSE